MAVLSISEYESLAHLLGCPIAMEPAIAEQQISIGAGSVQSAAFNASTRYVRVQCDIACSLKFGTNPTALLTVKRFAAEQTEYFGVQPTHKLAVIANP